MDYSLAILFGETVIISKNQKARISGNFIGEIFDLPTGFGILTAMTSLMGIIWISNEMSARGLVPESDNRRSKRVDFLMIFFYLIGAAVSQGLPSTFRLGSRATSLVHLYCFIALIFTTLFSSMVISKLLRKDQAGHIQDLSHLKQFSPDTKIIIKPNSYVDDWLHSPGKDWLMERVEYHHIDVSKSGTVRDAIDKILEDTHVLIDDLKNFKNYLRVIKYSERQFFFSDVVFSTPGGWIFPKTGIDPDFKGEVIQSLQWLFDLGIYGFYQNAIDTRLFNHLPKAREVRENGIENCSGQPIDLRDKVKQTIDPIQASEITGQPMLNLKHLRQDLSKEVIVVKRVSILSIIGTFLRC